MDFTERHSIFPPFKEYEQIRTHIKPYLTFLTQPNYSSKVIHTNSHGYRISQKHNQEVTDAFWEKAKIRDLI